MSEAIHPKHRGRRSPDTELAFLNADSTAPAILTARHAARVTVIRPAPALVLAAPAGTTSASALMPVIPSGRAATVKSRPAGAPKLLPRGASLTSLEIVWPPPVPGQPAPSFGSHDGACAVRNAATPAGSSGITQYRASSVRGVQAGSPRRPGEHGQGGNPDGAVGDDGRIEHPPGAAAGIRR